MDKVISFLLGEAVGETVGWRITPALPKNNLNYPQVSYLCNYKAITALNGTAITPKQYQVIVGI